MEGVDYYDDDKTEEYPFRQVFENFENSKYKRNLWTLILICTRLVLYMIMTIANIFLMYVIRRYKKLRTRFNMYIFNCCLLHLCLHLKDPVIFILFHLIFNILGGYFCVEVHSHTTVMSIYLVFAFLTAADWLLSSYKPQLTKTFDRIYIYFILLLYICFCIGFGVSIAWCLPKRLTGSSVRTQHNVRIVFYMVILIGITILNIVRSKLPLNRESLKTEYALTTANVIIYSFTPLLIHYFIPSLFKLGDSWHYIMTYTGIIIEFVGLINPVLVIYVLARQNKQFKMAYHRFFATSFLTPARLYDSENSSDSEEDDDKEDAVGQSASNESYS